MAIISIPSSIGGVTIPGITNVPGGPLGVLFGNNKQLSLYNYPRDLGSATKGHVVQFMVNEITPINYSESGVVKGLTSAFTQISNGGFSLDSLGGASSSVFQGVSESAKQFGSALSEAGQKISDGGSLQNAFQLLLDKRKKTPVSAISLYMPETVNFQQDIQYGKTSLTNAVLKGASLLGKTGESAASMASNVLDSDLTKLTLATQGLALNPQDQILFDGIDFRTFQMAFTFTPYSRAEAKTVNDIIKTFRKHAAPTIKPGAGGMFFVPPSTFNIKFLLNGKENTNVNRVAECVITNIDVNYAPNGWSAHPDGAPVQTTLTLQFKEIQLIDRSKVEGGY